MKFRTVHIVFFLSNIYQILSLYVEIQRSYEFENVLSEEQDSFWVWRSEASKLKTLRLVDKSQRYLVQFKLCIEPLTDDHMVRLYLDDIRYANDGPDDVIFVSFEGEPWYIYSTYEKWAHGHEWNIFRNTGKAETVKHLRKGEYIIGVSVATDKWGLELDKIRLNAEYQKLDSRLFCGGRLIDTEGEDEDV